MLSLKKYNNNSSWTILKKIYKYLHRLIVLSLIFHFKLEKKKKKAIKIKTWYINLWNVLFFKDKKELLSRNFFSDKGHLLPVPSSVVNAYRVSKQETVKQDMSVVFGWEGNMNF